MAYAGRLAIIAGGLVACISYYHLPCTYPPPLPKPTLHGRRQRTGKPIHTPSTTISLFPHPQPTTSTTRISPRTGGLGTATAQLLRSHGARLALLYAPFESPRRDSILKAVYGHDPSSPSWPADITTHECDITSESSVHAAFKALAVTTTDAFPSILVNAAGYVTVAPLEDTSADEAARNILPNLLGPFICSKAFFHLYTEQVRRAGGGGGKSTTLPPPPGRIVSISSQAAHVALQGHGPYCASKAGLIGLTKCMALEWGGKGITANTVSPTVVLTSLGKKAWEDPVKRDGMLAQIPTGRFAEPAEVAEAVEWLCRDGSGMVNGADIRLDGGFTIR